MQRVRCATAGAFAKQNAPFEAAKHCGGITSPEPEPDDVECSGCHIMLSFVSKVVHCSLF